MSTNTPRRGPSWQLALAVMVVGALLGVPLVVKVVSAVGGSLTADSHDTPVVITDELEQGRWVIFERTGTTRSAGPITTTENGPAHLSPESVLVTDARGERVDVRYDQANETITRGSAIYSGVLVFDVPRDGRYRVDINGDGQEVLLTPSLGETFRELGRPFGIAILGGLVFLLGATLLAVGLFRRRAQPAAAALPVWSQPSAGWYPNPEGGGLRYWDGSAWTDHVSP